MPFETGHEKTGGIVKGTKHLFSLQKFKEAFEADEKKYDSNIFEFFFEQARKDGGTVLVALMKKILPDMKQVETVKPYTGGYADDTPAEAAARMDAATTGKKPDDKENSL